MKQQIDLDSPEDAKKFLRGVRLQGKSIDFVILENGKKLFIENMTDEELVTYAKDIYLDFCGGAEGEKGELILETEGMDQ